MQDRYPNFAALAQAERRGEDYDFRLVDRGTAIVIIAPHGGFIEPGTTEIAEAIAGDDFSFYSFEGLRPGRPHRDLHITSHKFDEPHAQRLVQSSQTALAVHGRADNESEAIWMGGRHAPLKAKVAAALDEAGFCSATAPKALAAQDRANICNRGTEGAGVQLELPRSLRDRLVAEPALRRHFASAVRDALN